MKLLVTLFCILLVAGCTERVVPPVNGPQSIPFELILPQPSGTAGYYAISGVRLVTDEVQSADTILRVTGRNFYAQFLSSPGSEAPTQVELNGEPLKRHRDSDTLRLGSTSNPTLFGVQTWRITDAAGVVPFQTQALQELDSVLPVMDATSEQPLRADTSLTLSWRPPTSGGSSGILITWRMSGVETYTTTAADLGRFTIPANIVARFAGDSEIILTRYRQESQTFRGKSLVVIRASQRNYKLTII